MSKTRKPSAIPGQLVQPTLAERQAAEAALANARREESQAAEQPVAEVAKLRPDGIPQTVEPDRVTEAPAAPVAAMPERTNDACCVCLFWHVNRGTVSDGQCRRHPPVVLAGATRSLWPKTKADDWCGDGSFPVDQ